MSTYEKGVAFEEAVARYFEGQGYTVIVVLGSKPVDLVCFARGKSTLMVEAKSEGNVPKKQFQKQYALATQLKCVYVTVTRTPDGDLLISQYPPK